MVKEHNLVQGERLPHSCTQFGVRWTYIFSEERICFLAPFPVSLLVFFCVFFIAAFTVARVCS